MTVKEGPPPAPPASAGAEQIESRSRQCVGARFRVHGRDPETGLDCIGVAAFATGRAAPSGYALRGGDSARVAAGLDAAGLVRVRMDHARRGDVVLALAGPGQWHLAVKTDGGFVHADAGLRRVVERPGALPWPVIGIWRAEG